MLEFDMLTGEFLSDRTAEGPDAEPCSGRRQAYPELALLSFEEAEAERQVRR